MDHAVVCFRSEAEIRKRLQEAGISQELACFICTYTLVLTETSCPLGTLRNFISRLRTHYIENSALVGPEMKEIENKDREILGALLVNPKAPADLLATKYAKTNSTLSLP